MGWATREAVVVRVFCAAGGTISIPIDAVPLGPKSADQSADHTRPNGRMANSVRSNCAVGGDMFKPLVLTDGAVSVKSCCAAAGVAIVPNRNIGNDSVNSRSREGG